MFSLVYSAEAKRFIESIGHKAKLQIKGAVERIALTPEIGKRLTKELSGFFSYRTGDYRIIYRIEHGTVTIYIIAIGDRKDVYDRVSRRSRIA